MVNPDTHVFAHIETLVAEEHKLFDRDDPSKARERDADTVKKYLG